MDRPESFQQRILNWFETNGRKDLPWQQSPTPYRVWVSEIMLQQTQVSTVIPYYQAFMQRFPKLTLLAEAAEDDVLAHWSGLGYYARARNLHKTAKIVVETHDAELPDSIDELIALPGIGRSTAGAILSLALQQPHPILDGNVKRVLARHAAIDGWPGKTATLNRLWEHSTRLTPNRDTHKFNQAMMDLGATICTRTRPGCHECPVSSDCQACLDNTQDRYPAKKPKKVLPVRQTVMLSVRKGSGELLLERRPPSGIWGGLWSLPEITSSDDVRAWADERNLAWQGESDAIAEFRHTFSHFHLDIRVLEIEVVQNSSVIMEDASHVWYKWEDLPGGIAAPVARILEIVGEPL